MYTLSRSLVDGIIEAAVREVEVNKLVLNVFRLRAFNLITLCDRHVPW